MILKDTNNTFKDMYKLLEDLKEYNRWFENTKYEVHNILKDNIKNIIQFYFRNN